MSAEKLSQKIQAKAAGGGPRKMVTRTELLEWTTLAEKLEEMDLFDNSAQMNRLISQLEDVEKELSDMQGQNAVLEKGLRQQSELLAKAKTESKPSFSQDSVIHIIEQYEAMFRKATVLRRDEILQVLGYIKSSLGS